MNRIEGLRRPGIAAALGAALLFGAGIPLAKPLLVDFNPWLMAGLLYLGSGVGLTLYRRAARLPMVRLRRSEVVWFSAAVTAGGIAGPVFLMVGLTSMAASGASLLLNAEGVFTTLLAWFVFREHFNRRIVLGMVCIIAGVVFLGWQSDFRFGNAWPIVAVLAACLAWGIDNNLTRKVSLIDATWIASVKGLVAGSTNVALAVWLGAAMPAWPKAIAVLVIGFFAYGVSLALFVTGLRHLGTARTGAYFSVAPFWGALIAVGMGDPFTVHLAIAGSLMGLGIWLHLSEHHIHEHVHEPLEHEHEHIHDVHHEHAHDPPVPRGTRHTHKHRHAGLVHTHVHFPDMHHRHEH